MVALVGWVLKTVNLATFEVTLQLLAYPTSQVYEPELKAVGLAIVYVAAVAPEIKTPFRYHL